LRPASGSYIVGLDHVAAEGCGTLQVRGETLPVSDGCSEVVNHFLPAGSKRRQTSIGSNYIFIIYDSQIVVLFIDQFQNGNK
jgi:hypothetical protein